MNVAIIGIHTGIGKTVGSAVICEALHADYWKPVQAGSLEKTDSDVVRALVTNSETVIHPESYRLKSAMSPHAAAMMEGVEVELKKMKLPETKSHLIIETAGGLLSPLNQKQTNLDLVLHFKFPVIVISQNYLGSINHTLLTVASLKKHNVRTLGILFNGADNPETQEFIQRHSKLPVLGRMNFRRHLNRDAVQIEAQNIKDEITTALL